MLAEDHAPAICKQAVAGSDFIKLPRRDFAQGPIRIASEDLGSVHTDSEWIWFDSYSDVTLAPNEVSTRIGYFQIASGAGRGCDVDGIALLRGHALEKSARNEALIDAQRQLMNCRGSNAFLLQVNGETLVEIDGGRAVQRTVPPRALLRLRGATVETVCRVEQSPAYEPAARRR